MTESGEPIVLQEECRHCGRAKPTGESWFDEVNGWFFRCDECGRTMFLGYAEADNQEMVDAKRAYERSVENRARFLREKDTQVQGEIAEAMENLRETDIVEAYSFLFDPAAAVRPKEGWKSKDLHTADVR